MKCNYIPKPCCLLFQMTAGDLKDNLKKLNNSMAFFIKHSQKLFRVITDHTHIWTIKHIKIEPNVVYVYDEPEQVVV